MADPTITKMHLADACRANDLLADTGKDLPEILAATGIDIDGACHVATQRAIRMVLEMRGVKVPVTATQVPIARHDDELVAVIATAWIDGMLAGVKAKRRDISELIKRKICEWGHIEASEKVLRELAEEINP